jgi:hypothetical protein
MLQINKAQTKSWYLTLSEKTTIANPKYLFSITQRQSNKTTNFILTDISAFTERYNKFNVTEGTTFLVDAGEFFYKIYAQTSPTNLNPSLANELVEEGLLKVDFEVERTEYTVDLTEKIYEIEVLAFGIAEWQNNQEQWQQITTTWN